MLCCPCPPSFAHSIPFLTTINIEISISSNKLSSINHTLSISYTIHSFTLGRYIYYTSFPFATLPINTRSFLPPLTHQVSIQDSKGDLEYLYTYSNNNNDNNNNSNTTFSSSSSSISHHITSITMHSSSPSSSSSPSILLILPLLLTVVKTIHAQESVYVPGPVDDTPGANLVQIGAGVDGYTTYLIEGGGSYVLYSFFPSYHIDRFDPPFCTAQSPYKKIVNRL